MFDDFKLVPGYISSYAVLHFIHSHLIYSAPVLASLTHSLKNKLFIKQKKAIRIVCGKKSNSHTLPLFTRHNILPYPVLLKFYCIKFMWQYKCNKLPVAFSDIFPTRNPAAEENYDLRNINNFFVSELKLSFIYGSISLF